MAAKPFFDAPNDSHLCLSFICTTAVRTLTAPGRPGFTISGVGTQVRKVQFGDLADTCPTTHDKTIWAWSWGASGGGGQVSMRMYCVKG